MIALPYWRRPLSGTSNRRYPDGKKKKKMLRKNIGEIFRKLLIKVVYKKQ